MNIMQYVIGQLRLSAYALWILLCRYNQVLYQIAARPKLTGLPTSSAFDHTKPARLFLMLESNPGTFLRYSRIILSDYHAW